MKRYLLLCDERGGELRFLLQQRGEIQRISKTVDYINQNLDQPVSVEEVAEMFYMAQSTFYENFRNVMPMSPLLLKLSLYRSHREAGDKAIQENVVNKTYGNGDDECRS